MPDFRPRILYLNVSPSGNSIVAMTLAGIRRYAEARDWSVEVFSGSESGPGAIPALLASRVPVAGCVYGCGADDIGAPPGVFGDVPVVYLHAPEKARAGIVNIPTDNVAVARAAFRELSAGRPASFGVVGFRDAWLWSKTRERVFADLAAEAGAPCHAFRRRTGEPADARAKRLAAWVAKLPRRTAVFAVSDAVSSEIVAAARDARRPIPRELTLLGVDNRVDICETGTPKLSSIQIDFERAGYVAARMIGEPHPPSPALVGPLLAVRRESTGGWGRRERFVLKALERIRREACDGLTAAALASDFPGSRWLFEMRFREATGHSVLDEIQHVRLEKVYTLLARTDTAVGAIAGLCGYRTDRALRKLFLAREGTSMQAWRARNRQ